MNKYNFKKFLIEKRSRITIDDEKVYGKYKNKKINLKLKDFSIKPTQHEKYREKDRNIDKKEVLDVLRKGLPYVLNDYFNGEIEPKSEFVIYNKENNLNVICSLEMKKGPDEVKLITVIKKEDFKEKPNTYRYNI